MKWELHSDEQSNFKENASERILSHVPQVVYVDFKDEKWSERKKEKQWRLPGLAPGVYPIYSTERKWFVDHYKKNPTLGVLRLQIPLAPAFAITVHQPKGQTKEAMTADVVRGAVVSGTSIMWQLHV